MRGGRPHAQTPRGRDRTWKRNPRGNTADAQGLQGNHRRGRTGPRRRVARDAGEALAGAFALYLYLDRRRARIARARLRSAEIARVAVVKRTQEARLQAMQARVGPSFLFDTLAKVRALYDRDPAQGEKMLDDLIVYLRAAMPHMRDTSSTVGQELELARAWLSIMRIASGVEIDSRIDVDERALSGRLPPMLLLPLVDRALSGSRKAVGHRSLSIAIDVKGRRLEIVIGGSHPNVGVDPVEGALRERLAALFGDQARLEFVRGVDDESVAKLELPFEPVVADAAPVVSVARS